MKLTSNMKLNALYNLAERMGTDAGLEDAQRMRDLLLARGYTDTADVPEDEWLAMLSESVQGAA